MALKRKAEEQLVPGTKKCCRCKDPKPYDHFSKNKNLKDGLGATCKDCHDKDRKDPEKRRIRREKQEAKRTEHPDAFGDKKKCERCKIKLPRQDFCKNSTRADGLNGSCRECNRKYKADPERLKRVHERREAKLADDPFAFGTMKKCSKCKDEQPRENFQKCASTPDGLSGQCKDCCGEREYDPERHKKRAEKNKSILEENPLAFGTHKVCTRCEIELPRGEFDNQLSGPGGKSSICKDCDAIRSLGRIKTVNRRYKSWFDGKCCEKCGETNPDHLQAAHITREGKDVSPGKAQSIEAVDNEVPKCKVLCNICHQQETAIENGTSSNAWVRSAHEMVDNDKLRVGKCARCPRLVTPETVQCFHYDHLNSKDPDEQKVRSVSGMINRHKPRAEVEREQQKCQLLCAHCHIDVTNERKHDEWRIYLRFTGGEGIESLSDEFNLPHDKIDNIIQRKDNKRRTLEGLHGKEWTEHIDPKITFMEL
jgi:hypothetical protein